MPHPGPVFLAARRCNSGRKQFPGRHQRRSPWVSADIREPWTSHSPDSSQVSLRPSQRQGPAGCGPMLPLQAQPLGENALGTTGLLWPRAQRRGLAPGGWGQAAHRGQEPVTCHLPSQRAPRTGAVALVLDSWGDDDAWEGPETLETNPGCGTPAGLSSP